LTGADNGAVVTRAPFAIVPPAAPVAVERSPRIGITKATEKLWRYVEAGSSWSSRGRRAA
jgi:3-methyladenine DNA glycosylase Mpg